MAFSSDGKTIATSGYDDIVHLWDVTSHAEVKTFRSSHLASLFAVAFSPDGRRLIAGTPDGPVKLWDTESAQELLALKGHQSGVDCVSFTPDGETLVSANGSEVIRWVAPKLAQVK
jgi:WD40 repeat protein